MTTEVPATKHADDGSLDDDGITSTEREQLIAGCELAAKQSHSPYSGYRVGAAILLPPDPRDNSHIACSGKHLVLGCNVENSAYPDGCCAEKCAVVKAVSEGRRQFRALAVTILTDGDDFPRMCGSCRQVMAEFCDDRFPIYLVRHRDREYRKVYLGDYLPKAFRPAILQSAHQSRDVV